MSEQDEARRLRRFTIGYEALATLLTSSDGTRAVAFKGLPPDARIEGTRDDWEARGLGVRVWSSTFEPVEDGCHIPRIEVATYVTPMSDEVAELRHVMSDRASESEIAQAAVRLERERIADTLQRLAEEGEATIGPPGDEIHVMIEQVQTSAATCALQSIAAKVREGTL